MSLLYDRTNNISGVELLTGFSYNPEYGSSVVFSTKNNYFGVSDKYANISPMGLNTVVGDFSINLQLREEDAQKLINFYENQSGTGVFPISDGSNIYKTLSGTIGALTSFDSANNNKYTAALGFSVERNSSVLNWSGQSFVNHNFIRWDTGILFGEYDVCWFENDLEEPANNFFYCTGSHTSSFENHPLSTGQKWTNNLFLDTNDQFSFQQTPSVLSNDFKDSFLQRINHQKNTHSFDNIEISYRNISNKKTKALLHFCESRLGHKKFEYTLPEIYNKPKTFFAPSWTHKWNSFDSNDLRVTAIEDPLGIKVAGSPSLSIVQNPGRSNLTFSIVGKERLFYDTGNGKELLTGLSKTLSWSNSNVSHKVDLWGKVAGFTGVNQLISKIKFGSVGHLTNLNVRSNNISVLNLYDASGLAVLNCSNNNIAGIDMAGKANLTGLDCRNNSASYLNIVGCQNLVNLSCAGNSLSSVYGDGAIRVLTSNGLSDGYANISGSSGVSDSILPSIETLSGRNWEVIYRYDQIPDETTPAPPTTLPPVFPTGYEFTLQYSASNACASIESYSVNLNSQFFNSSTFVNFENASGIISGPSTFYLSDGFDYAIATKICCDKASLYFGGSCAVTTIPPTTPPPPTTIPPTTPPPTTPPPSTTIPPFTTHPPP